MGFALTEQEALDPAEGTLRRFDVELFIVHPILEPAEITAALGLEGHVVHRVGDRRKTPEGTLLPGNYPDTRWRHSIRRNSRDQWFAQEIVALIERLRPHKGFLSSLRSTGGKACIIVQFLGDGYFGDQITRETLAEMADLQLDFGIECFAVPQS
jgi:uncharacterized protein DUF4279